MIQETAYSRIFFPGQDWKKTKLGENLSGLLTLLFYQLQHASKGTHQ
jgi:hypothetical protein